MEEEKLPQPDEKLLELYEKDSKPKLLPIQEKVRELKMSYGIDLTAIMCGTQPTILKKWIRGDKIPNDLQQKVIEAAYEIAEILSDLPPKEAKMWLVSTSDYLYGVPAAEIKKRPRDVLLAALSYVVRGETESWLES